MPEKLKNDLCKQAVIDQTLFDACTSSCETISPTTDSFTVHIIDGMAEIQCLDKPDWIKNCAHLADHFIETIEQKYGRREEVRLIFDRYDIEMSLKEGTREERQGGQDAIYYRITDSTVISKVPMKNLLCHTKTKNDLTEYLAGKFFTRLSGQNGRRFVVSWRDACQATHEDVTHLQSSQEEADTKIILHAADATSDGATEIRIYSPDTDVLVLALRRYPELCSKVSFVTGKGRNHRTTMLEPIVRALGQAKTADLLAFHSFSGADNTGSFAYHAKPLCWKAFQGMHEDDIREMAKLGTTPKPYDNTIAAFEKLFCKIYAPKTSLTKVKDLRWFLFRKRQAESEKLPPSEAALREAVVRAHYQAMAWCNDIVANPDLPSPEGYGWERKDDSWRPIMTSVQPAPQAIIELVRCDCKTQCTTNRCQCRREGLPCTDLCACCGTMAEHVQ